MRVRLWDRLTLALILLLGTALRLVRLGAESLWYDEAVSVYLAGSPLGELIRHTAGDIHPPGYYILLRGWMLAAGYPTGHANPDRFGLEFAAAFFSLAFGVALIALVYSMARAIGGRTTALASAMIVAVSPYNIWYSQEARMYTLAAGLGLVVLIALLRAVGLTGTSRDHVQRPFAAWAAYAVCAAAGLYTVYYFGFLLLALNLWVLALLLVRKIRRHLVAPWLLANLGVLILYVPWIPVAWRQATSPPVPPWRAVVGLLPALRESWTALTLGQSAPGWAEPVLLVALLLYGTGLLSLLGLRRFQGRNPETPSTPGTRMGTDGAHPLAASFLPVATFGSLALILAGSAMGNPLYHVRYLFVYSPEFYVVLAAGIAWLWDQQKAIAVIVATAWIACASAALLTFWRSPSYRPDDLRGAAAYLEGHWRPGDVVLLNAGYAYPGLLTYWQGEVGPVVRLTASPPAAGAGASLVAVMTGHVDGEPGLGWGDSRSDFFAIPADQAVKGLEALFGQFSRIWHYRIYDTVTDPNGQIRAALEQEGQSIEDRVFAGEANMRVQGFVPRSGTRWTTDRPTARFSTGLKLQWDPLPDKVTAGETIYPVITWLAEGSPASAIATSVRLIGADGGVWSQPPDERPLGETFTTDQWSSGQVARQPLALPVPLGTPPGDYNVELVVYDPASGTPMTPVEGGDSGTRTPTGISLGPIRIRRPEPYGAILPRSALFGPLAVVEASTPATTVTPGDEIPVDLVWQAAKAPKEPMVVVLQLLDREGQVAAGLEEEPLGGRYPSQDWAEGEVVRDRHTLPLPTNIAPGGYRLIVGVYRAADGLRLRTHSGLIGDSELLLIRPIEVR